MGAKESSLAARDQNSPYRGFLSQMNTQRKCNAFRNWWVSGNHRVPEGMEKLAFEIWDAAWKSCCAVKGYWEPMTVPDSLYTLNYPSIQQRLIELEMINAQHQEYIKKLQKDHSELKLDYQDAVELLDQPLVALAKKKAARAPGMVTGGRHG